MKEMSPVEAGVTLLSNSQPTEAVQAPGLVWLCTVSSSPPSAHLRGLMAGLSKGGLGRWQVCEPPAGQPLSISLLEGRLRSALLVLRADTSSLDSGRLQPALRALALLGNQPLVVLLDTLPGQSSTRDDVDAAKARIERLATQNGLHQLEVVTVDAGIICLGGALLQMAGLRAAYVSGPLRMQVLTVFPGTDPTVYGELLEGSIAAGDFVRLQPSGQITQVRSLGGLGNRTPRCGDLLSLRLAEPADVGAVDLVTAADEPVELADEFQVQLISDTPDAIVGRDDWQVRLGLARRLHYARLLDLQPQPAGDGGASCFAGRLRIDAAVPVGQSPALLPMRLFSLHAGVDTPAVASGMLLHPSRAASHIHRQAVSVDKVMRARHMGQQPCVVWLTGLSGAGKSTIANIVEQQLLARGLHTYLLDGDNVRHGLNRDLGFTDQDRAENIRRVAEVAKLMVDAGLVVVTAFISPFRAEREFARRLMANGEFLEVHVDAPLALAEQRDVKGLYRKARRGEIRGFTGIDAPYEPPDSPELRINTSQGTAEDAAAAVLRLLQIRGFINAPPLR